MNAFLVTWDTITSRYLKMCLYDPFQFIYRQIKNNKPTGGRRELAYWLIPGEALWQLKIVDSATIR